ncbi:MAG: hypothetical protein H7319_01140 [Spirosoma sp.]|nr:hypothetical protein [Spirosoma sp.]
MNESIARKYEAGYDEVKLKTDFFPGDHTHTNHAGAGFNATVVAEGLKQLSVCPLNQYLVR